MKKFLPINSILLLSTASFWMIALSITAFALNNGLALTPPMGWNSWNKFGTSISENLIKQTADAMVSSGMAAVGYQNVNIDDCWAAMSRDGSGNLVVDAGKFPGGMKALADYVHSKGLRLGIYSDRGTQTCAGYPASQGREVQDAATFAAWGIDYLKYDNCNASLDMRTQYQTMSNALVACGRPIVFSICAWTFANWMPAIGNLWRTTGDINASWSSIMNILDVNEQLSAYAGPGAWNDPDMLEVGNGSFSDAENRAHFSLWAIMAAPLITGNDLRDMPQNIRDILTNKEVVDVDQDSLGIQGTRVSTNGSREIWRKLMKDSSVAVVLFNRGESGATISFSLRQIGVTQSSTASARDLWAHADVGQMVDSMSRTVGPHDVAMLRVFPGPDRNPPVISRILTYPDSAQRIGVVFSEPVDRATTETASNYSIDHSIIVSSATLQPDRSTVILSLSAALDTGATYAITVNNVTDMSGNAIAANSSKTFIFTFYKPLTKIRFYPRTGWESRMVGGVFEGTAGNKDSGPYLPLFVILSTPQSAAWTEVTSLTNSAIPFLFVRYRSPDNAHGNVAEVEFYRDTGKITGTPFGSPGTWNNSGNDFSKVFDNNVNTFFDCSSASGVYAGLDLSSAAPVFNRLPLSAVERNDRRLIGSTVRVFDLAGRAITQTEQSPVNNRYGSLGIVQYKDGTIRRIVYHARF